MTNKEYNDILSYLKTKMEKQLKKESKPLDNSVKKEDILVNIRIEYTKHSNSNFIDIETLEKIPMQEGKRKAIDFCKEKRLPLNRFSIVIFDEKWKFIEKYKGMLEENSNLSKGKRLVNIRIKYRDSSNSEKMETFEKTSMQEGKRKAVNFCKEKNLSLDDYSIEIFGEKWKFIEKYRGRLGENKFSNGTTSTVSNGTKSKAKTFSESSSYLIIKPKSQRGGFRGYK